MPAESESFEETYRPRAAKWLGVLLICVGFVGAVWFTIGNGLQRFERFIAYGLMSFFGLGAVVAMVPLLPGSSYLRLTAEGITVCSFWRKWSYRWSEIECFGVADIATGRRGLKMVGLNFSQSFVGRSPSPALRSINRRLGGFEGALPDNYGWDDQDLADHLNELKARFSDE